MYKFGAYMLYDESYVFRYYSRPTKLEELIINNNYGGYSCNRFTDKKFTLSNKDMIIMTKNQKYSEEIFDLYHVKVNSTIKDELYSEMNNKVQTFLSENEIKLPNLSINVVDTVNLTKEQSESTTEEKFALNPRVNFSYEQTPTNTGVNVVTGIDINIDFTVDEVKKVEKVEKRSFFSLW